jgi:hypothetical protein
MPKSDPQTPNNARRRERRPDGILYAIAGASRSGKSVWTAQQVAREPRLLVWDYPKGQWGREFGCRAVSDFRVLAKLVLPGAPPTRIAFMRVSESPAQDFETWARLAWIYVQAFGAPLVSEELATVTSPGKAPPAWGNICRMGMGYGSRIYAITQRPAESDKTFIGNAAVIRAGRFNLESDEQMMAKYLKVPHAEVSALKPLQFIERHAGGDIIRGTVDPKKRKK